jgi:hypothetical protein
MKKAILVFIIVLFGIFSLKAQTADTLENPGFERWEVPIGLPADHPEPVDWSGIKTSDNPNVNPMAPVNWARCDTAHSGKYSLKLFNVSALGLVATGTMTNGRVHTEVSTTKSYIFTDTANSLWNTHFTARPDSLTGWFMCSPLSGDHGNVMAILHTGYARSPALNNDSSTWIGKASFDLPTSKVDKWTRFSVPFKYYSNSKPQFILFILTSGNKGNAIAGGSALFDDLKVIFNTTGIKNYQKGSLKVFAYDKKLRVGLENVPQGIYNIRVLNILGRVQVATTLQSGENKTIDTSLPSGIYLVQAQHGNNILVKKILIQ